MHGEMLAMRARGHRLLLGAPVESMIHRHGKAAGFGVFAFSGGKAMFPVTLIRLAQWFRSEGVGIVNTHSSRDGWLAGLAARLARVPLLLRSRHIEVDYPNRLLSRIAFKTLPHHVLTTSRRISDRLVEELNLDASRVSCIPTGVDLERFRPTVAGSLHTELHLAPATPLVGMISVLRSWKGHEFFIGAAKRLVEEGSPAHFVIAGDGPCRDLIRQRIESASLAGRVHTLGHRDDVPVVLASLALLVLPSTAHEGIPQIILQAQAMGRPVVGTTVGGIPEVVEDGVTGLLAPPQDGLALAARIGALLRDPGLRDRLGVKARERVEQTHSVDAMCRSLETIYERYLGTVNT